MEGEIIDNLWIRFEMYNKMCNLCKHLAISSQLFLGHAAQTALE